MDDFELERRRDRANLAYQRATTWLVAALVFTACALPFTLNRAGIMATAAASADWPKAPARVDRFVPMSPSCATEAAGGMRPYLCSYVLEYRYTVGDRSLEGTRIAFLGTPLWSEAEAAFGGRDAIEVAYDPEAPERAVALPGARIWHGGHLIIGIELGIGLVALVLALIAGARWWRAARSPERRL